jgi:hypothetical protein
MRYRGAVESIDGSPALVLGPAWRRDCGLKAGDRVRVELEPEGPQRQDLAPDLAAALDASPAAAAFWDELAQFYRRAYLRWIDAARSSTARLTYPPWPRPIPQQVNPHLRCDRRCFKLGQPTVAAPAPIAPFLPAAPTSADTKTAAMSSTCPATHPPPSLASAGKRDAPRFTRSRTHSLLQETSREPF